MKKGCAMTDHPVERQHADPVESVDTKPPAGETFGNDTVDTKHPAVVSFGNDSVERTASGTFGNDAIGGFIRVRKRKLKGGHPDMRAYRAATGGRVATVSMSFDLVRAVRVNGKPRHEFVLGLGSQKDVERYKDADVTFGMRALESMQQHGFNEDQCRYLFGELIRRGARLPTAEQCQDSERAKRSPKKINELLAFVQEAAAR
jgi:hypothetical protein